MVYEGAPPHVQEERDEWELEPKELLLGPRIGIGSYGEVFRGTWRHTDVAVKRLLEQDLSEHAMEVPTGVTYGESESPKS